MEEKLPVFATLVAALELCRQHLSYVLKILTPWIVILTIALTVLSLSYAFFVENRRTGDTRPAS